MAKDNQGHDREPSLAERMGDSAEQRRMDLLSELREEFPNAEHEELVELANSRERSAAHHGGVAPELEDEAGDMSTSDGLGASEGSPEPRYGVNLTLEELRQTERGLKLAIWKDRDDGDGPVDEMVAAREQVQEVYEIALREAAG